MELEETLCESETEELEDKKRGLEKEKQLLQVQVTEAQREKKFRETPTQLLVAPM